MADKPKIAPLLKNVTTAPFIYFDNAPTIGLMNNIVELDLSARVLTLSRDDSVNPESVCVAHLRCSIEVAVALRRGIDKALKMARFDVAQLDNNDEAGAEPSPGDALRAKLSAMQ